MAVGLDFGTMYIVSSRKDDAGKVSIKNERNCFFCLDTENEDWVKDSNYSYIKDVENGEERIYICGKDALQMANLNAKNDSHGVRTSSLRRPMAKMVINSKTDKMAIKILKHISQSIIGPPKFEGEIAVISIPSDPISGDFNNVFHSNMCVSFVQELGYEVVPINEALAVVYATNPSTKDEDGETLNMTGIGISWGAGGTNGTLAYKGQSTIKFSVPRGGDYIDEQVAGVSGMTASEVTLYKEKISKAEKLDLMNPDYSDNTNAALCIYYKSLVEDVVRQFKNEFTREGTMFTDPIEVVVSGGTSKPKGFPELVDKAIKDIGWPFEISKVRRTPDALSATALGCLQAAESKEKKKFN